MWLLLLLPLALAVHVPLDDESTALVQRGAIRRPSGPPRLQAAFPLKFLHVPKSGTSFYNLLVHTDGVCPEFPKELNVDEDSLGTHPEGVMLRMCKKLCHPDLLSCNERPHEGLGGENWTRYEGHVVSMFRNPVQRICSAYYDPMFDALGDSLKFPGTVSHLRALDENGQPVPHRLSLQLFALLRAGDVTRQLVKTNFESQANAPVTEEESKLAVSRLQGFAFIGITEEWDLSVCLFHRIFGGECLSSDFEDMRPNRPAKTATAPYEDSDTITDPYDMPVYEEALRIFKQNLAKYHVSEATCKHCFAAKR